MPPGLPIHRPVFDSGQRRFPRRYDTLNYPTKRQQTAIPVRNLSCVAGIPTAFILPQGRRLSKAAETSPRWNPGDSPECSAIPKKFSFPARRSRSGSDSMRRTAGNFGQFARSNNAARPSYTVMAAIRSVAVQRAIVFLGKEEEHSEETRRGRRAVTSVSSRKFDDLCGNSIMMGYSTTSALAINAFEYSSNRE